MFRLLQILSIGLIFITPNLYAKANNTSCDGHQCIAVIDAGSTGSRLHIYAYDLDKTNSAININEVWNKKVKPGFASIDPSKSVIDAYLTNLLTDAPAQNLPVYFYATAGMRLLSAQKQKTYYQEVQSWFSNLPQWNLVEAKTITGTDEALYDWLSVNYQLGTLNSDTNSSIGVMDMGGASVQIVFPQQKSGDHQVEVDVYGTHHVLSVHSFLGLGQTEVSHQFLNSTACFSNDYPLPDGEAGHGDAWACATEVASLMNSVHGINNSIHPILENNHVDSWYVIGGLASIANSKPIQFDSNQLTLKNLLTQADSKLCQQQWDELSTQFPGDDYMYMNCFSSAYYYALVVDGYGLSADQTINYFPAEQNIDWTKGVVLHH